MQMRICSSDFSWVTVPGVRDAVDAGGDGLLLYWQFLDDT
jgi:hypothetical protein